MPWTAKSTYAENTNRELSRMLKVRGLPCSGRKAQLCARLSAHDEKHHFPFLNLPPEIRNTIYILVAKCPLTANDTRVQSILKTRHKGIATQEFLSLLTNDRLHGSPEIMVVQPGLFAVSKQIREEGLPLYFQHHKFACYLRDHTGLLDVDLLQWLNTTGPTGCTNLRQLKFRVDSPHCRKGVMDEIHRKLSDDATVIWQTNFSGIELWRIARTYRTEDPKKLPVLVNAWFGDHFDLDKMPLLAMPSGSSLNFYPQMGWFGRSHIACEREDTDIENDMRD